MLISIRHTTRYTYAEPVSYTVQSFRLRPPVFKGQRVIEWSVKTSANCASVQFLDGFGNQVELIASNAPHKELIFEAGGLVETEDQNGVIRGLPGGIPPRVYLKETPQCAPNDAIRAIAREAEQADKLASMHELSRLVRERVEYKTGMTDVHTCAADALAEGHGVCQDHAHVFISAARSIGVPARYVTGYLAADGADPAEAHHAWAEAWVDSLGWIGFDVANSICPTESYVRLSTGLDASTAAPITGSRRGGGAESLSVSVVARSVTATSAQQQSQSQG